MKKIDYVKEMKVMKLKENDSIVVKVERPISNQQAQNLESYIRNHLPLNLKDNVSILVLNNEISIGVLRG